MKNSKPSNSSACPSTDCSVIEQFKQGLGTPAQITALAAKGYAPPQRPKVNTHIHLPPNFSAFESIHQAVDLADEQHLGVLGASNYYHYGVYADFTARCRMHNIFPLFGLEIIALLDDLPPKSIRLNDPANPGKMYICGKGITRFENMTAPARKLIQLIRQNDSQRMARMIDRLAQIFYSHGLDTKLTEQAVIDMIVRRHRCPRSWVYLQERHLALAFQQALFDAVPLQKRPELLNKIFAAPAQAPDDPTTVQGEIRSHLMKTAKPAYVKETFVNFQQAYRLILELGGIPCYPVLADGADPICEYEQDLTTLIDDLKARGIHCVEFIPLRNSPDILSRYAKTMHEAGLLLTCGTEHNTLDLLPLEPACKGPAPIGEETQEIFWEGACVVAAHQFLCLHGRCGFVDQTGKPNPVYSNDQARIQAFSELGAALIQRYYQSSDRQKG